MKQVAITVSAILTVGTSSEFTYPPHKNGAVATPDYRERRIQLTR
jgi:hypothetical protein